MRLLRAIVAAGAAAVTLGLLALIVVQCAKLLERNISLSRELAVLQGETADLQQKESAQKRMIARLRDPSGAIPEIHQRLRVVRSDETLIYVQAPQPTAAALP